MIRIWGGGIYESDYLYDLCDSLGIMVWQDFMFACAMYPNDPKWETEFSQQVNRLKYHPSIALWCGNNENDEGWKNWGWQKQYKYTDSQAAYIQQTNEQLFQKVIPEILFTETQNIQNYHSSSPLHGWGRKESMYEGDSHYWGVWWGKQPFTIFNEKVPRFMSEYGFQGMPVMNSFKQFIPSDELMLGSPSVKQHQKHPVGYETIAEYMAREYQIPVSFEDYIYVSQLLQAGGMRTAIEAHRRNRPYCMGTLFWQLNDCWPVTSWSVIDYYTKKAYADVMISVVQQNGKLETWFVNDGRTTVNAKMYYRLFTTKGRLISEKTLPVTLDAAHSIKYTELEVDYFLEGYAPENCVLYVSLLAGDTLLAERYHQFTPAKQVTLQTPEIQLQWDNQRQILTVTSDVYTMGVYLYTDAGELKLSDNFFDLLPSTPKEISLQGILPDNSVSNIKIKSLNTIYKTL
jgi:beta-mannosidase